MTSARCSRIVGHDAEDRRVGRPALFPDIAGAFEKQLRASQELAVTAMHLAELDGVELAEPDDPEAFDVWASQLVADFVDPPSPWRWRSSERDSQRSTLPTPGCGRSSRTPPPR